VVSTKVGGIPEVVREGTGLLVPPKDGGALARAVETLLLDEDLRENLGRAGSRWIVENLTWTAAAERLEKHLTGSDR
jgi:glycosyltransferase involved in cell wall biosynthesis